MKAKIGVLAIQGAVQEHVDMLAKLEAEVDGRVVAAEQGNMLATSFHPELTEDLSFHRYFVEKALKGKK